MFSKHDRKFSDNMRLSGTSVKTPSFAANFHNGDSPSENTEFSFALAMSHRSGLHSTRSISPSGSYPDKRMSGASGAGGTVGQLLTLGNIPSIFNIPRSSNGSLSSKETPP